MSTSAPARRLAALVAAGLLASGLVAGPAGAGPTARLLVTLDAPAAAPGPDAPAAPDLAALGATVRTSLGRVLVLELPATALTAAQAALAASPGVLAVERDVRVVPATFDPGYPQQWGLENTGQEISGQQGQAAYDAEVPEAWRFSRGDGRVVAVLDGAVDLGHQDLQGAFRRNPDEVADGTDSDGNGFVDDLVGWDFADGDADVSTTGLDDRHGTELAGAIAARADNGIGLAGVAPRVQVLPVRFVADGSGLLSDAVAALAYAADEGADAAVLSWVGAERSRALRAAVQDAGIPVAVPAGNGRSRLDEGVPLPHEVGSLVVVAAMDNQGRLPSFSNRGRVAVDLLAPGWQILTTGPRDTYARVSGTSLAAAFTAASLALVADVVPEGTSAAEQVEVLLTATHPQSRWRQLVASSAMLDLEQALGDAAFLRRAGRCDPDADDGGFDDVPEDGVHAAAIACAVTQGLASGFADGTYRPTATVTRGQVATLLVGLLVALGEELPQDPPDAFPDDDGSVHEPDIDVLAAMSLVAGREDGGYHPADALRRDEAASLVARVYRRVTDDLSAPSRDWFDDDDRSVHAQDIDRLRDVRLVSGTGPVTYGPAMTLTRGQAATLLADTLDRVVRERAPG